MAYDIIVRFPNKKMADKFCSQMSDGFGENYCDFRLWRKKPNTKGDKNEDYEQLTEGNIPVCFVNDIFDI